MNPYTIFHAGLSRQNYSLEKDPKPIFNLRMSYIEEHQVASIKSKMNPNLIKQKYGFYEDMQVDYQKDIVDRQ